MTSPGQSLGFMFRFQAPKYDRHASQCPPTRRPGINFSIDISSVEQGRPWWKNVCVYSDTIMEKMKIDKNFSGRDRLSYLQQSSVFALAHVHVTHLALQTAQTKPIPAALPRIFEWGGDQCHDLKSNPPLKFCFSSVFGHLIL